MNDLKQTLTSNVALKPACSQIPKASFTISSANTSSFLTSSGQINNLPIDTKKKKTRTLLPTIRFDLKLNKPSSDKFTEFNYNKLVLRTFKCAKQINKKTPKLPKTDNQQCEQTFIKKCDLAILDDEFKIERKNVNELLSTFRKKIILSKELDAEDGLEAKNDDDDFSNQSELSDKKSKKKNKKSSYEFDVNKFKLQDFSYLGKGYDDNDSFIDNSDAHDVHLPTNMVPKRGGFYINRERLKLKKIDEVKKCPKKPSESEMEQDTDRENVESEAGEGDSEDFSGSDEEDEDDDDEDSEDETSDESGSDELESEIDEEVEGDDILVDKNIPEIDLASSSGSCKVILNTNQKKSKKRVIEDEDEDDRDENEDNNDLNENNDESNKNKENNAASELIISNLNLNSNLNKKRKNIDSSQTNDLNIVNNIDKVQSKLTYTNGDNCAPRDEIISSNFKKKKIDPIIDQATKSTLSSQVLNDKNRDAEYTASNTQIQKSTNQIKEDSNDYIDVEDDHLNQTNTSLINTSLNRSNLNQSIGLQSSTLPDNIPEDFRLLINKLIDLYTQTQTLNLPTEPLSHDFKNILLKIYSESKRLKLQSQAFNYISLKVNRNKDSLFRICRRMLTKETGQPNPSINTQIPKLEPNQNSPIRAQQSSIITTKSQNKALNSAQNLQKTPQTPPVNPHLHLKHSPASPQFTFAELSEEMRTKLLDLKKDYAISKQKLEVSKFFDNLHIHSQIYSLDNMVRKSRAPSRLKDFCLNFLTDAFEFNNKDLLMHKYNQIVAQTRQKSIENTLLNKMNELRKEVEAEMPKNLEKFSKQMEEFNKNRVLIDAVACQDPEAKKKLNPPRKRFELSEKMRESIANIIQLKMRLFKPGLSSPSPSNSQTSSADTSLKLDFIQNFFDTELINLWPKNWMQKNLLIHIYQTRYCQSIQQLKQHQQQPHQQPQQAQQQRPQSNLITQSKTAQNSAVINISSKNGKQVKIEQQTAHPNNVNRQNFQNQNQNQNQKQQLLNQQQLSKHNVYESVVSQHKKKPGSSSNVQGSNSGGQLNVSSSGSTSINVEEMSQTVQGQSSKSAHNNLFQISSLIQNSASAANELQQIQQTFNFMLPNLISNSSSFANQMHPPIVQQQKQSNQHHQNTASK